MTGEDLEDLRHLSCDILCEIVSLLDTVESSKTNTVEIYSMSYQHLYCETRGIAQPIYASIRRVGVPRGISRCFLHASSAEWRRRNTLKMGLEKKNSVETRKKGKNFEK